MNLKDFDFVNECVDFVNTFAPGTAKKLEMNTLLSDPLFEKYNKIVDMAVNLKSTTPEGEAFKARAESAKAFLKDVRKNKTVSGMHR